MVNASLSTLVYVYVSVCFIALWILIARIRKAISDIAKEEIRRESEQKKKIKSLYPEVLTYEQRMGVKYGPDSKARNEGATGSSGDSR